jgi:hypothetical protein
MVFLMNKRTYVTTPLPCIQGNGVVLFVTIFAFRKICPAELLAILLHPYPMTPNAYIHRLEVGLVLPVESPSLCKAAISC